MTGADEYAAEFAAVRESLATTCQDLLDEFQHRHDWPYAAAVSELGDLAGTILHKLGKISGGLR